MPNERLRRAIHEAGLQLDDLARHVGVDAKTVERWITKDRLPHPANRAHVAQMVGVDEFVLWPQLVHGRRGRVATEAELIAIYPTRGAVPADTWYDLLESARTEIDVLVYAGLFLPDGRADLPALLRRKGEQGVQVRLLYGDPGCDEVALRGSDEGIGDGMAARIRLAVCSMRPVFDVAGVEARSHGTTLYNSIYRFDDELLVNAHAYGVGAPQSPVLHLRRIAGGQLFDHYMASFERVWGRGVPMTAEYTERAAAV
ncbi:MAG: helix-turn-helix domain-containing protein [Solirubrobacteraceae bacterium]